jgi:RNA polymerase sigma factor (sigma-70 family)
MVSVDQENRRSLLFGDRDLVGLYRMEAEEKSGFSEKEAQQLLKSIRTSLTQKDRHNARTQLIEGSLDLVFRVAWWFRGRGMEPMDLIGNGNLGLAEAVDSVNSRRPKKDVPWRKYACYGIRWAIVEGLEKNRLLHISKRQDLVLLNRLRVFQSKKENAGVSCGPKELIDEVLPENGKNRAERQRAWALLESDIPTESLDNLDLEILPVCSPNERQEDNFEIADQWLEAARLTSGPKGERAIMSLLYGSAGGGSNLTYEDVGDLTGLHKQRVGLLFKRSKQKLAACAPAWTNCLLTK